MSQDERIKRLEEEVREQKREINLLQNQIDQLLQRFESTQNKAIDAISPSLLEGNQQNLPAAQAEPSLDLLAGEPVESPLNLSGIEQESAPTGAHQEGEGGAAPTDWEHLIGRVWLPRVFLLVLLLGVIWGFRAGINAGLLTESVRCVLGGLAGIAFLWLGEKQVRDGRIALGQVLLGGAVTLLVLTTFAAHVLYGFIGVIPAFVIQVLIIAGGVYLALRHRSQALAILVAIGGFLVPFLLKSETPSPLFFVSYEVISSLSFLLLALRQNYRVLFTITLLVFHLALAVFLVATRIVDENAFGIAALLHHLALLVAMFALKRGEIRFLTLFTSAVFTIGWWYLLFVSHGARGDLYEGLLIGLTLLYAVLGASGYKRGAVPFFAVSLTICSFSLMLLLLRLFGGTEEAIALVIEGTALFALAFYLRATVQSYMGALLIFFGLIETVLVPIPNVLSEQTVAWLALLAGMLFLILFSRRIMLARSASGEIIKSGWAVFNAIAISFAFLLLLFLTEITDLLAKPLTSDYQHVAVSAVWALYAVVAIIFGTVRHSSLARIAGIALLFITLLKLIFFDLPSVSILIRAILFIGLGAVGIAISRLFYQKK